MLDGIESLDDVSFEHNSLTLLSTEKDKFKVPATTNRDLMYSPIFRFLAISSFSSYSLPTLTLPLYTSFTLFAGVSRGGHHVEAGEDRDRGRSGGERNPDSRKEQSA
jgi:hypothetical protein